MIVALAVGSVNSLSDKCLAGLDSLAISSHQLRSQSPSYGTSASAVWRTEPPTGHSMSRVPPSQAALTLRPCGGDDRNRDRGGGAGARGHRVADPALPELHPDLRVRGPVRPPRPPRASGGAGRARRVRGARSSRGADQRSSSVLVCLVAAGGDESPATAAPPPDPRTQCPGTDWFRRRSSRAARRTPRSDLILERWS